MSYSHNFELVFKYSKMFRLPPSARLGDVSDYIFKTISFDGTHVDLYDEQKPLSQLQSCLPVLELVEPKGNFEEKSLSQKIS